jgi:hypothetical protein
MEDMLKIPKMSSTEGGIRLLVREMWLNQRCLYGLLMRDIHSVFLQPAGLRHTSMRILPRLLLPNPRDGSGGPTA